MTYASRESSTSQGHNRGRASRLSAGLGLAGIAFLSAFPIGSSEAQTPPLPPSTVDATNYVVTLSLDPSKTAPIQSGLATNVLLSVKPKTPMLIAREFAWQINTLNPPSEKVVYTKRTLTNADGTFTSDLATFKVGFVPGAVGNQTLLTAVHLQVCDSREPTKCVTNWVNVSLTVPVVARLPKVDDSAKDKPATP